MIVVAAFSCTGLGLINAAISLRVRENAVLSNVIFGFLLIFTGANVPLSELPELDAGRLARDSRSRTRSRPRASSPTARRSPRRDRISRRPSSGSGSRTLAVGYVLLRFFEWQGRKHATLEQLVSRTLRLFWTRLAAST